MKVIHFHRKPFPSSHSIEGLFASLRDEMASQGVAVERKEVPWFSKGLLPRIRSMIWAFQNHGDVNHITGDVHFLVFGLPKSRTILTVHDLTILSRMKGLRRFLIKLLWFDLPVKRVAAITVISKATKDDLLTNCRVPEDKIVVIPDAVSPVFQPCPKEFNVDCPRILQIGTGENKNLNRLFAALEGVACRLHLVGRVSDAQIRELQARHIVHEISVNLTQAEVYQAYCQADMVTFVSTKEGFGMPILEAQWVERPVVTSNCSSMPEVAGDGACFVDPCDIQSIRSGIRRVIADRTYREGLICAGRLNRKRYELSRVANAYAALYQRVASTSPA